jgi:hypothetical protein
MLEAMAGCTTITSGIIFGRQLAQSIGAIKPPRSPRPSIIFRACVPGARQVSFPNLIHNAPSADPVAFTTALFEFLAKRQGF